MLYFLYGVINHPLQRRQLGKIKWQFALLPLGLLPLLEERQAEL
jgi:hypothetical protein